MFSLLFILFCIYQPILHYYSVFCKRESLQRYIVEEGDKPAIFGSYSYDPVKQVFIPPPPDNGTDRNSSDYTAVTLPNQIVNDSYIYSTAIGDLDNVTDTPNLFPDIPEFGTENTAVFRKRITDPWWSPQKSYTYVNSSSNENNV